MTACNGSLGMGILMMLWNCSSKIDSEDDHKLIAYSSSCTLPGQEYQKLPFLFKPKNHVPPNHDGGKVNSICPEILWKGKMLIQRAKVDLKEQSRYVQRISLELSYIITTYRSHDNMTMRTGIC